MPSAHIHLLLDASKSEGELLAECPSCGAMVIESLMSAWRARFMVCECGITMEVLAEDLRQLRVMASDYQRRIDELVGTN